MPYLGYAEAKEILFKSIEAGDLAGFEQGLKSGHWPKDELGNTVLHKAVASTNTVSIVRFIVRRRRDKEFVEARQEKTGYTAMHVAAAHGNVEPLHLLLQEKDSGCHSANIHALTNSEETALHLAVSSGEGDCLGTVRVLLGRGVDMEAKTINGETAMDIAARCQHGCNDELINMLKEAWEVRNDKSLYKAIEDGDYERAESLMKQENGIVNHRQDGYRHPPLHHVVYHRQPSIAKLLVSHKANIEAKDFEGKTALHLATWRGCVAIVDLLLEKKANVNARTDGGSTPLHFTVNRDMNAHHTHAIAQILLDHGANRNARNGDGKTPNDVNSDLRRGPDLAKILNGLSPTRRWTWTLYAEPEDLASARRLYMRQFLKEMLIDERKRLERQVTEENECQLAQQQLDQQDRKRPAADGTSLENSKKSRPAKHPT